MFIYKFLSICRCSTHTLELEFETTGTSSNISGLTFIGLLKLKEIVYYVKLIFDKIITVMNSSLKHSFWI